MKTQISRSRDESGFTLMELIFAAVAFSVIVLVLQTTLSGVFQLKTGSQERYEARAPREHARELLRRDLFSLSFHPTNVVETLVSESGLGGGQSETIEFYTESGILQDEQRAGRTRRVRWELRRPLMEEVLEPHGFDLVRSVENSVGGGDMSDAFDNPVVVARGVFSLDFDFFDGNTWRESWDSQVADEDAPLPALVRVELRFLSRERDANGLLNQQAPNPLFMDPLDLVLLVTPVTLTPPEVEDEDTDSGGDANADGRPAA